MMKEFSSASYQRVYRYISCHYTGQNLDTVSFSGTVEGTYTAKLSPAYLTVCCAQLVTNKTALLLLQQLPGFMGKSISFQYSTPLFNAVTVECKIHLGQRSITLSSSLICSCNHVRILCSSTQVW